MFLALAFVLAQASPDEAAATAALDAFKAAVKADKEPAARAAALAELAKTQHDKVYVQLGKSLLSPDELEVHIAAAKGLGGCTGDKRKPVLSLVNALAAGVKEPKLQVACLEALGKLQQEGAAPEVEKQLKSRNDDVVTAAATACGEIRNRTSIPALIELLKQLELHATETPDLPGAGGGKGGVPGGNKGFGNVPGSKGDGKERLKMLAPPAHKALQSITGMKILNLRDWEDWWKEKAGTFKVQK